MKNYTPIFRLDVCNYLLAHGYELIYVRKNYTVEGQVVFMFEQAVTNDVVDKAVSELNNR